MTTTAQLRIAATTLGTLALAGTIAGCSNATGTTSGAGTTTTDDTATSSTAPTTSSTPASTSAASGSTYADGEYKATASYQSPGGTETITVDLTVASDKVTAVTVTGEPTTPDATNYQGQFESNIASLVVGKNLDDITVSKVAGSSLTSSGFSAAVDDIKSQAAA